MKKILALSLIVSMLFVSEPMNAYAATDYAFTEPGCASYDRDNLDVLVSLIINIYGYAVHTESFLNSVYDVTGIISTAESDLSLDAQKGARYEWGALSGNVTISASTFLGASGSVGVGKKEVSGSAEVSIESKSTSASYSCSRDSEVPFSACISAMGFFSCDLIITQCAKCYDTDTGLTVDTYSKYSISDLYSELDY